VHLDRLSGKAGQLRAFVIAVRPEVRLDHHSRSVSAHQTRVGPAYRAAADESRPSPSVSLAQPHLTRRRWSFPPIRPRSRAGACGANGHLSSCGRARRLGVCVLMS
jgi:hypothetical protein